MASSSAGDLNLQHGISNPDDPSDGGINSAVGHGEKATRIVDTAGGFFLTSALTYAANHPAHERKPLS